MSIRHCIAGVVLAVIGGLAVYAYQDGAAQQAARAQIRGNNYVIIPWNKTPLQMELMGSGGDPKADSKVYVLINGRTLYKADWSLDDRALDWNQLSERLRPFSKEKNSIVEFSVLNYQIEAQTSTIHLLGWALDGFGRTHAGFDKAYVSQTMSGAGDFWRTIDSANQKMSQKAEGPEPPIGDDLVQVYPVQTFLSCVRSGEADCVVKIVPRLTKNTGNALPKDIRDSIVRFVPRADVGQKGTVLFMLSWEGNAKQTVTWFRTDGCKELAHSLSFVDGGVTSAEY